MRSAPGCSTPATAVGVDSNANASVSSERKKIAPSRRSCSSADWSRVSVSPARSARGVSVMAIVLGCIGSPDTQSDSYRPDDPKEGKHMTDVPAPHPRRAHRPRSVRQRPLVRGALRRRPGDRRGHRPRLPPHRVPARQRHAHRPAPAQARRLRPSSSASSGSDSTTSRSAAPTAPSSRSGPRRLDELGVEHGGIKDAAYGSGVSFRDPDGIALEFFAPPS